MSLAKKDFGEDLETGRNKKIIVTQITIEDTQIVFKYDVILGNPRGEKFDVIGNGRWVTANDDLFKTDIGKKILKAAQDKLNLVINFEDKDLILK